ncbi:MAG: hypothetical protein AABX53_03740 [Nanoarchaeota archaeon]
MLPAFFPVNPQTEDELTNPAGLISRLYEEIHLRAGNGDRINFDCIIPREEFLSRSYGFYLARIDDVWSATLYLAHTVPRARELGTFFCTHALSLPEGNQEDSADVFERKFDPELRERFGLTSKDASRIIAFYWLGSPYVTPKEILSATTIHYHVHAPEESIEGKGRNSQTSRKVTIRSLEAWAEETRRKREKAFNEFTGGFGARKKSGLQTISGSEEIKEKTNPSVRELTELETT